MYGCFKEERPTLNRYIEHLHRRRRLYSTRSIVKEVHPYMYLAINS